MALDKNEIYELVRYIINSEMVKALLVLEGMLKGMAMDGKINPGEIAELENWFNLHKSLLQHQSFYDLYNALNEALKDGCLSAEEKADIIWLCSSYTSNNIYFDLISSDMQKLYGLLYGIIADNKIDQIEIERLSQWLAKNDHLHGIYPYDELCSLIEAVLKDGQLSSEERDLLKLFFSDFVDTQKTINLNESELEELRKTIKISGICAVNPQIVFQEKLFCFTGTSSQASRAELKTIIESQGGRFNRHVVKDTDYLVIGDQNNPCWAFSCYGRKVDQAVKLRKAGSRIQIIHEEDFWKQIQLS